MSVSSGVLLMVVSLAALWDISLRRIPNGLLIIGWLIGFGLFPEPGYILKSLVPVLLLYLPWGFRMIGAGDIKLLAVACGYLPVGQWCDFFLIFILFAGGMSLLRLILYSDLWVLCSYRFNYLKLRKNKKNIRIPAKVGDKSSEIPLAAAVMAGVLGSCF